jgi:hypothetical protein
MRAARRAEASGRMALGTLAETKVPGRATPARPALAAFAHPCAARGRTPLKNQFRRRRLKKELFRGGGCSCTSLCPRHSCVRAQHKEKSPWVGGGAPQIKTPRP